MEVPIRKDAMITQALSLGLYIVVSYLSVSKLEHKKISILLTI